MVFNQASVLAPAAAAEFGVAAADVAYYVSIVYLAAMISTVGGGTITRRLGPIRFIQTGLTIAALGSFVFATGGVAMAALSAFIVWPGFRPAHHRQLTYPGARVAAAAGERHLFR